MSDTNPANDYLTWDFIIPFVKSIFRKPVFLWSLIFIANSLAFFVLLHHFSYNYSPHYSHDDGPYSYHRVIGFGDLAFLLDGMILSVVLLINFWSISKIKINASTKENK